MSRVSLCLGILVLLIMPVVGACASTRPGAPPARSPKSQTCIACKGASDCGGYQSCPSGCCESVDDENPLEQ
jgi:hypothetical protein